MKQGPRSNNLKIALLHAPPPVKITPIKSPLKRDSNVLSPDVRSIRLFENQNDEQTNSTIVLAPRLPPTRTTSTTNLLDIQLTKHSGSSSIGNIMHKNLALQNKSHQMK